MRALVAIALVACGRINFDANDDVPVVPTAPEQLVWFRTFDAIGSGFVTGLGFDESGTLYVGGTFDGTADFGTGPIADNATTSGNVFLVAYDRSGTISRARTSRVRASTRGSPRLTKTALR